MAWTCQTKRGAHSWAARTTANPSTNCWPSCKVSGRNAAFDNGMGLPSCVNNAAHSPSCKVGGDIVTVKHISWWDLRPSFSKHLLLHKFVLTRLIFSYCSDCILILAFLNQLNLNSTLPRPHPATWRARHNMRLIQYISPCLQVPATRSLTFRTASAERRRRSWPSNWQACSWRRRKT